MWKTKLTTIKAKGLDGDLSFSARALTADEIQQLLLRARKDDWLGKPELVDFVVRCGVSEDQRRAVERDRFLGFNVGREVWILTLRAIARHTRKLLRLAGMDDRSLRPRRYRYSDLATPGFLRFMLWEMDRLDIEGFSRHMFRECLLLEVKMGDRLLSKVEREAFMNDNFEALVPSVLTAIGLDRGLVAGLPPEVLPSAAYKFYVAVQLASTLDWYQYQELVKVFNQALRELLFRSNQLGGADTTRDKTSLITGLPLLPELIKPVSAIPPEVAIHLLHGVATGNLRGFRAQQRALLRTCLEAAHDSLSEVLRESKLDGRDGLQRMAALLLAFEREINRHPDVVKRSCFVYMKVYCDHLDSKLGQEIERHKKAVRHLSIPDCRVLVEGPSDEVLLRRFLQLVDTGDLMITVEGCGGKADVARRTLELRKREAHAGAIVAILDADALQESKDLTRALGGDRYAAVLKLGCGVIENLFSPELHCEILNSLFSEGEEVLPGDLDPEKEMDKVLKKVLWEKKRASFDKRLYAEELAKRLRDADDIPIEARSFVATILQLARRRRRELPKAVSHLSVDNFKGVFAENLIATMERKGYSREEALSFLVEIG